VAPLAVVARFAARMSRLANNRRLLKPLDHISQAEAKAHFLSLVDQAIVAARSSKRDSVRGNRDSSGPAFGAWLTPSAYFVLDSNCVAT